VVNAPLPGVVPPIGPGAANVAPFKSAAFRLGVTVVLAMENGAVPVAMLETSWLEYVHAPLTVQGRFDAQNMFVSAHTRQIRTPPSKMTATRKPAKSFLMPLAPSHIAGRS